jgi:GT2 family glycosyltransferase
VRVVRTDNRGPAAARNIGAAESAGGFIAFLDADDIWKPERVARCIEMLDGDPSLAWVTTDLFVMEGDTVTDKRWYDRAATTAFVGSQIDAIARANFVANGCVIRRDWFERAHGFDEAIHGAEDYELWMRLILAGGRVGLVDEPLGCYRVHDSSLTARGDAQWQSHLDALERNLAALVARGASPRSVDAIGLARRFAARGDRVGAARFVAYAARDRELPMPRRAVLWARVPWTLLTGRV